MTRHALVRWDADAIAGWEREAPTPDDDPQARIALLAPVVAAHGAQELIPSWGADVPPDAWVELQLRARHADRWSKWFRIAVWDSAEGASRRSSFGGQEDADGQLATDTLLLTAPAEAVQARALLCAQPGADMPELESLALAMLTVDGGRTTDDGRRTTDDGRATSDDRLASTDDAPPSSDGALSAIGYRLSAITMPLLLSQYLSDPESGQRWCSPVALTMTLAHWHARTDDARLLPFTSYASVLERAVPLCFDPGWEGTGNWAFNTALAASLGLTAYVTRLHSLEQLARWTAAGVPVPISIRWEAGELEGLTSRSSGHITVVTGFAGERVLMAEPAAREQATVARSYDAAQLFGCWQRAAQGVVYLIYPQGWARPEPGEGDAWV